MIRKNISHTPYFLLFIVILIIFTFPVTLNMNKAVYGPLQRTDNRAAIWHFSWFNYAYNKGLDVNTNTLVNYPFGAENMAPGIFPLCMFPAYIFSILVNEIFAYNALLMISFILSFFCMYVLVFYLTKNRSAAFISGLIYSLSPYHVNKTWEHFGLAFIEFIPLYIYSLLKLKDSPSFKRLIFCALSLSLVVLSDFTYSYIIFIFSFFYIIFCFFYYLKRRKIKVQFIPLFLNFIKMGALAFILIFPLLIPSLKEIFFSNPALTSEAPQMLIRPFKYLFSQSATVLAYLVPSKYHPLWGGLARSLEGTIFFGRGSIEQTLYLGWMPMILFFIAYKSWKKKKLNTQYSILDTNTDNFMIGFFIFTVIVGFVFSMPPYWNLLVFKIYFPSFFMYKILPAFRAYARFGVLSMVAISVLAGYGVNRLMLIKKKRYLVAVLISFLVLVDFINIPPMRVTSVDKCPEVYSWLAEQRDDFVIIEYPIKLGDTSEGYINLDYLLYQRVHKKAMVNGAAPGTKGYAIKQKIVKITDKKTPSILSALGVKYVVMHLADYRESSNREAANVIGEAPDLLKIKDLKFIKRFGDDEVYEVIAEPSVSFLEQLKRGG